MNHSCDAAEVLSMSNIQLRSCLVFATSDILRTVHCTQSLIVILMTHWLSMALHCFFTPDGSQTPVVSDLPPSQWWWW